jgi:hypothetical protein
MDSRTARIVALTQYLGIRYISESWASHHYPQTIKAVQERFRGHVSSGLKVEWHPREPSVLYVREQNSFTHGDSFSTSCVLADIFGDQLIADLEALAMAKTREDIKQERDERLTRMAERRMNRIAASLQAAAIADALATAEQTHQAELFQ